MMYHKIVVHNNLSWIMVKVSTTFFCLKYKNDHLLTPNFPDTSFWHNLETILSVIKKLEKTNKSITVCGVKNPQQEIKLRS